MTIDKAKVLLCQMYLPQFDEEEKQALTMAIEALEELKEARKGFNENRKAGYKHGYYDGYNNAIDYFVKECEAEYDNDGCPNVADYLDYKISIRDLWKIAEQLKAGGIDGNERADT